MSSIDLSSPDKRTIQKIFDTIAQRYDFLNTLLSFRLDELWRRRAHNLVYDGTEKTILDLGVGTGKFLLLFLNLHTWKRAVGLDFSGEMLRKSRQDLPASADFVSADFHDLPFQDKTFDLVISSFALRSVKDMPRFLEQIYDLLTERGKVALLCLTRPQNFFFKWLYYPYLRWYLPMIGFLFSGNREAYQFLSQSIQTFQSPTKTVEIMKRAGFRSIEVHLFTFGAATLIIGRK